MYHKMTIKYLAYAALGCCLLGACGSKDPHRNGIAAGKAACECYQLETLEEKDSCLDKIDSTYKDFYDDTAFTNAMEVQQLRCIGEGVLDIVK